MQKSRFSSNTAHIVIYAQVLSHWICHAKVSFNSIAVLKWPENVESNKMKANLKNIFFSNVHITVISRTMFYRFCEISAVFI